MLFNFAYVFVWGIEEALNECVRSDVVLSDHVLLS